MMKSLKFALAAAGVAGVSLCVLLDVRLSAQQSAARTGLLSERGLTATNFPQNKKLADNVYVWTDVHPSGLYTTNDLIVITANGVLVADGQKDPPTTKKMVDFIKGLTSQPIRYVVVASEHGDHTGGNESFPPGATFISSPASQTSLAEQARGDKPGRPKTIVPAETVADRKALKMGATDIQIMNLGRAHTGGDIEVYLPAEKIFFVSEVFSNHLFPQMRAAPPKEWIQTLKNLEKVDAKWVIPGHGFVDDPAVMKEELTSYEKLMEYVVGEITRLHNAGVPVDAALKQANWGPYASWPVFDRNGQTAVQRIYDELDGKLK
ncbi:MAG TPA: MBL fold metallo-hydrolase [Vicinamibacterales bacterium]|jgi:glyoxylase-like metal-dependent hydrolase (beta-lactamase superfamily II)|nr:MBL fold metallo-hydrolase [Vicinamibacterales bacterium]